MHRHLSIAALRYCAAALLALSLVFFTATPVFAAEPLDDFELLARLVWLEARGEPDEGQQAVVQVVLNRVADGRWGDTIYDVVFASGQFTPAKSIRYTTPTEKEYQNVQTTLSAGEPCLPPWVMYFAANGGHRWSGYEQYTTIGGHWFGGFKADRRAFEATAVETIVTDVNALFEQPEQTDQYIFYVPYPIPEFPYESEVSDL